MPKFSKISFTMAVDRNAVIKLCNSGKSNVEIAKFYIAILISFLIHGHPACLIVKIMEE